MPDRTVVVKFCYCAAAALIGAALGATAPESWRVRSEGAPHAIATQPAGTPARHGD